MFCFCGGNCRLNCFFIFYFVAEKVKVNIFMAGECICFSSIAFGWMGSELSNFLRGVQVPLSGIGLGVWCLMGLGLKGNFLDGVRLVEGLRLSSFVSLNSCFLGFFSVGFPYGCSPRPPSPLVTNIFHRNLCLSSEIKK